MNFNTYIYSKEGEEKCYYHIQELDMSLVAEYAYELPKSNTVMETLRLEVL